MLCEAWVSGHLHRGRPSTLTSLTSRGQVPTPPCPHLSPTGRYYYARAVSGSAREVVSANTYFSRNKVILFLSFLAVYYI